jgi:hypothetical protein
VPLPVHADEHIGLRQVRPVHLGRRIRPGPPRTSPGSAAAPKWPATPPPLLSQLAQRGTDKHPNPPVRRPDDRLIPAVPGSPIAPDQSHHTKSATSLSYHHSGIRRSQSSPHQAGQQSQTHWSKAMRRIGLCCSHPSATAGPGVPAADPSGASNHPISVQPQELLPFRDLTPT